MPKQHRVRYKVRGRVPFPVDMLRYDACAPFSEADSYKIAASIRRDDHDGQDVEIEVKTLLDRPPAKVSTPDRWRSFGWEVVPHSEEPIV